MDTNTLASDKSVADADAPPQRIDQQRRELQARIDALRQAGLLPAAQDGDRSASIAQWTNWSNG